jgi:Tol biopolymer transport system component
VPKDVDTPLSKCGVARAALVFRRILVSMRRVWTMLLLAGCGRIAFDPLPSGSGPDGGSIPACASYGPWSAPVLAATLSTALDDYGPALSADGLEVIFHRDEGAGGGRLDLFRATRPDRASSFGAPDLISVLNSAQNEENATLSTDGLTIYFTSDRSGATNVYRSDRPDLASPFAAPTRLDALGVLEGPELSADGTELFGSRRAASSDLYRVTDFASSSPVSQRLTSISDDTRDEFFPTLTADGLTIYYEISGMHIHRAHRAAIGDAFIDDGLEATFASAEDDTDPSISHDGYTFMFSSLRSGASFDLFISQRDCQ